jgi:hypothetical protein
MEEIRQKVFAKHGIVKPTEIAKVNMATGEIEDEVEAKPAKGKKVQ